MKKCLVVLSIVAGLGHNLAAQETIFYDGFESGTFDSTAIGHWVALPGDNGGVVSVDDNINSIALSHNGVYGVALGRETRGAWTKNALDLHLDLSGQGQVELSFWIKDTGDDANDEDGIWFSDNGGASFAKVFDFKPNLWVDNEYGQFPPLDLDALAAEKNLTLTDKFIVRFQQYGWYELGVRGIYLDDVSVTVPNITYATLPFEDDFEEGSLGSAWTWANSEFPALTTVPGTVVPGGRVLVTSNVNGVEVSHLGFNGVALGNAIGGVWTTNALDLHLNLAGQDQVELSFWIKDTGDETQNEDGIWFSPNGGKVFKKLYSFDPRSYPNNAYSQLTVNLDSLVQNLGLSLTDKTVLRFQQYGWYTFGRDGLFLDDFLVKSMTSTGVEESLEGIPSSFALHQNYPNPFNPTTNISYDLPRRSKVLLTVYDITGKEVTTLVDETKSAGAQHVTFEGASLPGGLYLYRVKAGAFQATRKMIMMK